MWRTPCASWLGVPDITDAFFPIDNFTSEYNLLGAGLVYSDSDFLAGVSPLSADLPATSSTIVTPVSVFNSSCSLITGAGTRQDQFSYYSECLAQETYFGNTTYGDWIYGTVCGAPDNVTYVVEIVAGGLEYDSLAYDVFGVKCFVSGSEGMGSSTYNFGLGTKITVESFDSFETLSVDDMVSVATAVLTAISAEAGLQGKLGRIGASMASTINSDASIDLDALASGLSNTMAAAAAVGYNYLLGASSNYSRTLDSLDTTQVVNGFGWRLSLKTLAWSIVCIFVGLAWYGAAAYMIGGGTRYDPTDWYQTINTSAGSNLAQLPGTCTGANLKAGKVNNHLLWYGELGPGHVGFSQQPTRSVHPKHMYGDAALPV